MAAFSADERAQLAHLVPIAQRLASLDMRRYYAWISLLNDHERALLVRWIALYGINWRTHPSPKAEQ